MDVKRLRQKTSHPPLGEKAGSKLLETMKGGPDLKAAFLTYNRVGNLSNGWNGEGDHQVFVASHPRGQRWGAEGDTLHEQTRTIETALGAAFEQIEAILSEIDLLVVYVGDSGSEGAIELASRMPAHKVAFVFCSCNFSRKRSLVAESGMSQSQVISCECGGHGTMGALANQFIQSGSIG